MTLLYPRRRRQCGSCAPLPSGPSLGQDIRRTIPSGSIKVGDSGPPNRLMPPLLFLTRPSPMPQSAATKCLRVRIRHRPTSSAPGPPRTVQPHRTIGWDAPEVCRDSDCQALSTLLQTFSCKGDGDTTTIPLRRRHAEQVRGTRAASTGPVTRRQQASSIDPPPLVGIRGSSTRPQMKEGHSSISLPIK